MLYRMETVSFLARYTFNGYYNWCKCSLLYLHQSCVVLHLLLLLVALQDRLDGLASLAGAVSVCCSDIKEGILASSVVMADRWKLTPLMGCRGGSI